MGVGKIGLGVEMKEGCVRRDSWNLGVLEGNMGVTLINNTLSSFLYAMRDYFSICVSNRLLIDINLIE